MNSRLTTCLHNQSNTNGSHIGPCLLRNTKVPSRDRAATKHDGEEDVCAEVRVITQDGEFDGTQF